MSKDARPLDRLSEDQVHYEKLRGLFASILVTGEIDASGYLYLAEELPFPMWLFIDEERKLLQFITYTPLVVGIQDVCPLSHVNGLNRVYIGVQFHHHQDRLWANTWMSYDTGIILRHLFREARRFSSAAADAFQETSVAIDKGRRH